MQISQALPRCLSGRIGTLLNQLHIVQCLDGPVSFILRLPRLLLRVRHSLLRRPRMRQGRLNVLTALGDSVLGFQHKRFHLSTQLRSIINSPACLLAVLQRKSHIARHRPQQCTHLLRRHTHLRPQHRHLRMNLLNIPRKLLILLKNRVRLPQQTLHIIQRRKRTHIRLLRLLIRLVRLLRKHMPLRH